MVNPSDEPVPAGVREVSQAVEDYIKEIYQLQQSAARVSTSDVARAMGISAASVTKMSKYLAEHKLLTHEPYHGVKLTEVGEKIALETIRHHRLIELYLVEALGYGWDEVDAEAERLEHHISEEFEARIDRLLGFPRFDPHGHPIPDRDGEVEPARGAPLTAFQVGDCVEVVRVSDLDPRFLQALTSNGIGLNAKLEVLAMPFDSGVSAGDVRVRHLAGNVTNAECTLRLADAGSIFVEGCAPSSRADI